MSFPELDVAWKEPNAGKCIQRDTDPSHTIVSHNQANVNSKIFHIAARRKWLVNVST